MSDPRSDLPLFPEPLPERTEPEGPEPERARTEGKQPPETREYLPPLALEKSVPERLPLDEPEPAPTPSSASASLGARWKAGLFDVLLHTVLGLFLLAGSWFLGARIGGLENLGVATFLVVFSFLYTAIPLAFWGQTPGMAWADLAAATGEDGALAFGQTALRWLGGLLTVALLGLPSLLVLVGGRSLTDRLSGSQTRQLRSSASRP